MIIILRHGASQLQVDQISDEVVKFGYRPVVMFGDYQTVIAAIGDETTHHSLETLTTWPQVENVIPVQKRYKLVSRQSLPRPTFVEAHGQKIGAGQKLCMMAGPCSVESEDQLFVTARAVKKAGATFLRGGAFKPRTSPYDFQGLGKQGLELLSAAKKEFGLGIITEVLAERDVELVAQHADILQIGARNAQNFVLLQEAAKTRKPILLKRGMAMKIEEWLSAAEYILAEGNPNVLLCERGIRTFETYTRNTLDLAAIAILKQETHLPVIIDPSQGCGRSDLIIEMCKGAVAMNADGLLIEVHPNPAEALSDGQQQVDPPKFEELMGAIAPFAKAAGRGM